MLTVAAAGAYVFVGLRDPWDFETYYHAARAFRAGLNPYSMDALAATAQAPLDLPFLYPPVALAWFLPLTWLPIGMAAAVWLAFKSILLVTLIWIWRRSFLPEFGWSTVLVITLLGFNLSALWDLRTGNVALLEATLLWLAFLGYVHRSERLTVYLIVLGSVFKLLPILLLGLLGLAKGTGRRRLALIASGVAVLAATVSLPTGMSSEWRRALFRAGGDRPTGDINPSALGVADWLVAELELPSAIGPNLAMGLYLAYVAVVLALSIGPLLRVEATGSRREQVVGIVLLWLLLLPRTMVYSYVMAIVPVLYVLRHCLRSTMARGAAYSLVVGQGIVRLLPGQPPALLAPLSFLILLGTWLVWVRRAPVSSSQKDDFRKGFVGS
jgi:hypothetical protein